MCELLSVDELTKNEKFNTNQNRVKNREELYELLNIEVEKMSFDTLYEQCLKNEVPIGKLRNLKEVFELPEAKAMLKQFSINGENKIAVNSIAFKFIDHV